MKEIKGLGIMALFALDIDNHLCELLSHSETLRCQEGFEHLFF